MMKIISKLMKNKSLTKYEISQVINVSVAHIAETRHRIAVDSVEDDDNDRLQEIKDQSGILLRMSLRMASNIIEKVTKTRDFLANRYISGDTKLTHRILVRKVGNRNVIFFRGRCTFSSSTTLRLLVIRPQIGSKQKGASKLESIKFSSSQLEPNLRTP